MVLGRFRRPAAAGSAFAVLAALTAWAANVSGYPPSSVDVFASQAWLASGRVGQVALVDGSTAEVAAQIPISRAGHDISVVQVGADAVVADRSDGAVLRVDGATHAQGVAAYPFG